MRLYEEQIIENLKLEDEYIEGAEFTECTFINCTWEMCRVEQCIIRGCKFIRCNIISLRTKGTQLKNAEFEHCNLIGVHWNDLLPEGRIQDPVRKFSKCVFKYNTFVHMSFVSFDFSGNIIQDSIFDICQLKNGIFKGSRLENTQFLNCDLRQADFRDANGYQIDIKTNRLKGARFSFPEVVSLLNALEIKID